MTFEFTFKQYLESKEMLREAVKNTPQRSAEYLIRKYCKFPVGESKENNQYISLKPKQKIIVEWLYNDVYNPTIVNVKFDGLENISSEEEFQTYWSGMKLQKWLLRNTREQST